MIFAAPYNAFYPVERVLERLAPSPKKALLVRCAPAELVGTLVGRLESAFPDMELAVLSHTGRAVDGVRNIEYPHKGFFRAEHAPMDTIRSEGFDLMVLPYATDRRHPPAYANVDRIASESGAPRALIVYSDNQAALAGQDYFERKRREIVAPYLLRREKAIAEICSFTGDNPGITLEKCEMAGLRAVKLWLENNPRTESQVRSYYSQNDFYIYELIKTEYNGDRLELLETVLEECEPGRSVLDYGAGVGIFSLPLAEKGCRVTHLDLPGPLLDFARHRFALRGLEAGFVASSSEEPLENSYDIILSVFVIEHLTDPRRTVAHLERHLAPGGKMLLAVDFEDRRASDELLPLHLTNLGREDYYDWLTKIGLVRLRGFRELDVLMRKSEIRAGE